MHGTSVGRSRQEGEVLRIRVVLAQLHVSSTSRNPFLVRFSALFPEDVNSVHTLTYWHAIYSSISSPVCFPEHEIAKGRGGLLTSLTMSSLDARQTALANDTTTTPARHGDLLSTKYCPFSSSPLPHCLPHALFPSPSTHPPGQCPLQSVSQHAQLTRHAYQGYSAQDSAANYGN